MFYSETVNETQFLEFIKDRLNDTISVKPMKSKEPYGNCLQFAWENSGMGNYPQHIQDAKNIISNTDELVIIGYSFPEFNREIDKYIFSESKFEKIYFQTEKHNEGIKSRVMSISNNIKESDITMIDDLSQFYIPFSV